MWPLCHCCTTLYHHQHHHTTTAPPPRYQALHQFICASSTHHQPPPNHHFNARSFIRLFSNSSVHLQLNVNFQQFTLTPDRHLCIIICSPPSSTRLTPCHYHIKFITVIPSNQFNTRSTTTGSPLRHCATPQPSCFLIVSLVQRCIDCSL